MKGVMKRPPVVVLPDEALVAGGAKPRVRKKKKPKPEARRKRGA
jgi:hypothetical protein